MRVYFAGPLFCSAEQAFNLSLAEKLEGLGFAVFLPQRDGVGGTEPLYDELPVDEIDDLRRSIFAIDRDQVLAADVFLFVLDGRVPDEGACVELGMAYTQKCLLNHDKFIVGLHTDMRGAFGFLDAKLNPMLLGAFDDVVEDEAALIAALTTYQRARQQ